GDGRGALARDAAAPRQRHADDLSVARRPPVHRDCHRRGRGRLARRVCGGRSGQIRTARPGRRTRPASGGTSTSGRTTVIAALILALAASSISGVVHDSSGGVVPGAAVIVRASGSEQRVTTGPDGPFTVDAPGTVDVVIVVRAGGFAEKMQRVDDVSRSIS